MSQSSINTNNLRTTVNIYRKSMTVSDVGDFRDNDDTLIYSDIATTIQPKVSELSYEIEGVTHFQTHIGYLNSINSDQTLSISVDDIVEDNESNIRYTVIGVENHKAANVSISGIHHIKLTLEAIGDYGESLTKSAEISSKASIE